MPKAKAIPIKIITLTGRKPVTLFSHSIGYAKFSEKKVSNANALCVVLDGIHFGEKNTPCIPILDTF